MTQEGQQADTLRRTQRSSPNTHINTFTVDTTVLSVTIGVQQTLKFLNIQFVEFVETASWENSKSHQ